MRKILPLLAALMMVFGMSVQAKAILFDNGDGTITDQDANLMWLQDANLARTSGFDSDGLMTWADANRCEQMGSRSDGRWFYGLASTVLY